MFPLGSHQTGTSDVEILGLFFEEFLLQTLAGRIIYIISSTNRPWIVKIITPEFHENCLQIVDCRISISLHPSRDVDMQ
jgi:hypothetical protein